MIGTCRRKRAAAWKGAGYKDSGCSRVPAVGCRHGAVARALPGRVRAAATRAGYGCPPDSARYGLSASQGAFAALKVGTRAAGTAMGWPVRGLRPGRAARVIAANFPRPATVTVSPWASASAMVEVRAPSWTARPWRGRGATPSSCRAGAATATSPTRRRSCSASPTVRSRRSWTCGARSAAEPGAGFRKIELSRSPQGRARATNPCRYPPPSCGNARGRHDDVGGRGHAGKPKPDSGAMTCWECGADG